MTEIEKKALELVREVAVGYEDVSVYHVHDSKTLRSALCRAIEQHEAFRQEVSDAVEKLTSVWQRHNPRAIDFTSRFARFIIAKPDPLVEAVKDILDDDSLHNADEFSEAIRAALAKRGGRIVFDD